MILTSLIRRQTHNQIATLINLKVQQEHGKPSQVKNQIIPLSSLKRLISLLKGLINKNKIHLLHNIII